MLLILIKIDEEDSILNSTSWVEMLPKRPTFKKVIQANLNNLRLVEGTIVHKTPAKLHGRGGTHL